MRFFTVLLFALAAHAEVPLIEHSAEAYGAFEKQVVARVKLWPDLAPHETKADPGRFYYDAQRKTWRRGDVSAPELVIFKPAVAQPSDTLVMVLPGGG